MTVILAMCGSLRTVFAVPAERGDAVTVAHATEKWENKRTTVRTIGWVLGAAARATAGGFLVRRPGHAGGMPTPAAILDIDGTLVDTNYQHAISWFEAFRQSGATLPVWRLHRSIGKGGDQLVADLMGEEWDAEHGDAVRDAESSLYMAQIRTVAAFEGAAELVRELADAGPVVLASSAKEPEVEHYLDLLDVRDVVTAWTTSADVESTKPEPDLVEAAMGKLKNGRGPAVMVGDTPWDVEAARRADVSTIAVVTGGFSRAELVDAGAVAVYDSVEELRRRLGETALAPR